jgi:hypothetical protein
VLATIAVLGARRPGFRVRLIGSIPHGYDAAEALQRLASASGAEMRALGEACDSAVYQGAPRVLSKRSGEAHMVEVSYFLPPAAESTLRARLVDGCHLALPAPWGGLVGAFISDPAERRQLRLVNVPEELRLEALEAALTSVRLPPADLAYDTDPVTKLPRADIVTCTVPAAAKLPDIVDIRVGLTVYEVKLRPVSSVPPPPQWTPRQQPAPGTAVAGTAAAGNTSQQRPVSAAVAPQQPGSYAAALAREPPRPSSSRPPTHMPPSAQTRLVQAARPAAAASDPPPPASELPAGQPNPNRTGTAGEQADPAGEQQASDEAADSADGEATAAGAGGAAGSAPRLRRSGRLRGSSQRSPSPPSQRGAAEHSNKKHAGTEAFAHAAGVTDMHTDTAQTATTAGGTDDTNGGSSGTGCC